MMKFTILAAAVMMVLPLTADPVNYRTDFTVDGGLYGDGALVAPTGSFTYDPETDLFSNFNVTVGEAHFLFPDLVFPSLFTVVADGPCAGTVSPVFAMLSHSLSEACTAPQPSQFPPSSGLVDPGAQPYFFQYWTDSAFIFTFGAGPQPVWSGRYVSIHGNITLGEGFNRDGSYGFVDLGYQGPVVNPEYGTFTITRLPEPATLPVQLLAWLLIAFSVTEARRATGLAKREYCSREQPVRTARRRAVVPLSTP